jgi:hypothetical protein
MTRAASPPDGQRSQAARHLPDHRERGLGAAGQGTGPAVTGPAVAQLLVAELPVAEPGVTEPGVTELAFDKSADTLVTGVTRTPVVATLIEQLILG